MTICTFKDSYWNGSVLGAERVLTPWLRDRGSLTLRIKNRCDHFSVINLKSGLDKIAKDEAPLLGIAQKRLAWSREVFLCANDKPVVFAHSTCTAADLNGAWSMVSTLGNRPLGAVLFSHPEVLRRPLRYKALHATHPLYRRAASMLSEPPGRLWARRSLFCLHGSPLLVTEVFLPDILKLRDRTG